MRHVLCFTLFFSCSVGMVVNASERIAGSIGLTSVSLDIGPKSVNYNFSGFALKAKAVLDDKYFFSITHSDTKHRSVGKRDGNTINWSRLGYQLPLSNILGNETPGVVKLFTSVGYMTLKETFDGRFPDNNGSGTSYSIGTIIRPSDLFEFSLEISPVTYNTGSLKSKTQQLSDVTATYFINEKIGLTLSYRYVKSQWAGAADAKSWSTGIEVKF